jgi:hypothetical protein
LGREARRALAARAGRVQSRRADAGLGLAGAQGVPAGDAAHGTGPAGHQATDGGQRRPGEIGLAGLTSCGHTVALLFAVM